MEVRCIAFTKNGRCKRQGHWLCHQHVWSFPLKIILAIAFVIGFLSNLGNIRDHFFTGEKPLYLNLSATKSNDKWLSFYPDANGNVHDIAIWIEEHNPNDEAIEIQIVDGSVQVPSQGRNVGDIIKTVIPLQNPVLLGPSQKQIATGHLFLNQIPVNSDFFKTLIEGNSYILVDTYVRFRRVNSKIWYTMEIKYTLNGKGWNLISRNIVDYQLK